MFCVVVFDLQSNSPLQPVRTPLILYRDWQSLSILHELPQLLLNDVLRVHLHDISTWTWLLVAVLDDLGVWWDTHLVEKQLSFLVCGLCTYEEHQVGLGEQFARDIDAVVDTLLGLLVRVTPTPKLP